MFCETCGKKLIRGYSFCVDCGTPVPPGAFDREEEETPVTELKPGMGIDDAMPGIAPKRTSAEGANLSSGSRVPLFNTDNTGLGGLGLDDPNQAFTNLFGNPSVSQPVNNSGFNSGSSNIDMPSIEAPAKSSQAKQKQSEKGETVLLNDFSMSSAAGDETLEISDNAVTILGGTSAEMGAGADIDLSPYKFLDNKIDLSEEPAAVEPEPVAVEPEPVAVQPEPVAVEAEPVAVEPEPVAVEPEPVVVQPEPVVVQPEPVAVQPEPVAVQPEPVAVEAEPVAVQPEPVAVEPEPVAVEAEPVAVQPEPVAVEAEPVAVQPEPVAVEPEPVVVQPEPVAVEPEPVVVQPEPVVVQPEPVVVQPEPVAAEPLKSDEDDFVPEEMQVIEETLPFIEEAAVPGAAVAVAEAVKPETKPSELPEPITASVQPKPAPVQPKSAPVQPKSASVEPKAAPEKAKSAKPAYDPVLGKLVYCRTCGQDMYEKEEVCKNCGAKRKPPYVPPKQNNEPKKLFGILPVSAVVGMASVVVVMTALIIFLAVKSGSGKVPVGGEISGTDVSSASSASSVSPSSSSASSAAVSSASSAGVSSSSIEPEESGTSSSEPESSVPESTSSSASSSKASASTTKSSSKASTAKSSSKSSTKSSSSSSSKASSSSVKPQSSSTTTSQVSDTMTAAAASYEYQRTKLVDAAALIAGEAGKIHIYSQFAIKSKDADSSIPARLTSALMSSIESGRSSVDQAINGIGVVSTDLTSCKNAVVTLREKYDAYYKYIKGNSDPDANKCSSLYSAVEQALRTVRLNQYASCYNSNDKRLALETMNSTAVKEINSTYTKFYNLRETFSKTSLNYASTAYNTLASGSSTFCDAVLSSYKVKAYGILMGDDATISSNFNSLYQRISIYINLDDYAGKYNDFYNAAY